AATNASAGWDGGAQYGHIDLSEAAGGLIIKQSGIAGVFRGKFTFASPGNFVQGGANASLLINTTGTDVDETINVNGQAIRVKATAAQRFEPELTNIKVKFGDFLTLAGDFKTENSADGTTTTYAATKVEIFLGEGPYRNDDGSLNPDALGVVVTNGTVGVVRFNNSPATTVDDTFAIYASGTAGLVGIPGLTVGGTIRV